MKLYAIGAKTRADIVLYSAMWFTHNVAYFLGLVSLLQVVSYPSGLGVGIRSWITVIFVEIEIHIHIDVRGL